MSKCIIEGCQRQSTCGDYCFDHCACPKTPKDKYDSSADTLMHIRRVNELVNQSAINLINRAINHDYTKLQEPEKSGFDMLTPEFRKIPYGSPEYYERINHPDIKFAIEHHHKVHSHHTEHHKHGIEDMTLMDMIEMLCDWKAATERNPTGVFSEHLAINIKRFNVPDSLARVLRRTAMELGFIKDTRYGKTRS